MDSPSDFVCISFKISFIKSSSAALLPVEIVSGDFFVRVGDPTGVTNSSGDNASASSGTSLIVS